MAGKGNYGNISEQGRLPLGRERRLPGNAATAVLILAVGPVLGLIYAASLPFIGMGIVTKLVLSRFGVKPIEGWALRIATFHWRPAEAYLAGRQHAKRETGGECPPAGNTAAGKDRH